MLFNNVEFLETNIMDNIFINNACKPGKFIWTNDSEKEAQLCNIVSTSAYFIKYFGMSK